jgi:hypothetical protein
MGRRVVLPIVVVGLFVAALAGGTPAGAVPPNPVDDGNGKQFRQLYETTGLTWDQVAAICPQDGVTPCSGSIGARDFTGWTWATADQVVALMGNYAPAILTASPPQVGGADYFTIAAGFLAELRWTNSISLYGAYSEWNQGWTASKDGAGVPIVGHVGYGWWPPSGGFSVLPNAAPVDAYRGVYLWRPSGRDYSPPAVTPAVSGTLGTNGWYVSDVSVTWDVHDAESAVTSTTGCDPATVSTDTAGTTLTCSATSEGGTGGGSALVLRDTTPPTVTCPSPAPVFQLYQLGAWVTAAVTDATSGRATAPAQGITSTTVPGTFTTSVTGADRAGNRATVQCAYQVVIPSCNGLTPTRVGTSLNDTINGTSGRDVIVGLGGADTVKGNGGDDVICGGDGPDLVDGGDGNDWIDGGASPDDLSGGNGNDFLDGGPQNDSLRGDKGTDTCVSGETRLSGCEL